MIADVNGIRTEAQRDLNAEREAERQLVGACLVLEQGEQEHGEWLLGQPVLASNWSRSCRRLDPASIVVAWPEGESFRVTKKATSKSVRVQIKRDKDWFAASGDIVIDEGRVMNLRTLLEKLRDERRPLRRAGRQPVTWRCPTNCTGA